ncbi:MAG: hypothetical protein F4Y58_03045 [Gammaproteobacteria bacterium]|nr:hypothetical protein [Gammaproteobacteria bacterium]
MQYRPISFLRISWFVFGCFMLSAVAALELGNITVDSEAGQIFDAQIALRDIDIDNLAAWYAITAGQDDYQAQGLEYINGLHDRLVIEVVTSASPPYIAISSLASISRRSFDLLVRIGNGEENLSRSYKVILKELPPPVVETIVVMTSAEMLNYLTNELAVAQNLSTAEVWGSLKSLTDNTNGGEQKLISHLRSLDLDRSFVFGIVAMLSERQKTIFNRVRAESGAARAVASVLFAQQDFLILNALFAEAMEHSLEEGTTKSQKLAFEKERAAILQNKLYALEYSKLRQALAAKQAEAAAAAAAEQAKKINWLDYRSWLDYLEWGKKPLLSNAKLWIVAAVFLGILLLLLSIRLFRAPKAPPVRKKRRDFPLPGQVELEKLRTPHVYINPSDKISDGQTDEIIGKINRAEAYIEMGENDEARRLLDEAEQQSGDKEQQERIHRLRDKMKQ